MVYYLIGEVIDAVQVRVDHAHDLLYWLTLELAHRKHPLVQPCACPRPQRFLYINTLYHVV